jgi:hypothetical protein
MKKKRWFIGAALAAALLVGGLGIMYWRRPTVKTLITREVRQEYADADRFSVEIVDRTTREKGDLSVTSYDRYLVSEVDLNEQVDWTEDYQDALRDESTEAGGKTIAFKDAFGFSYAGMNGVELLERLLRKEGFSISGDRIQLNREKKEQTGQTFYEISGESPAEETLLEGIPKEDIRKRMHGICMRQDSQKRLVPDCFLAEVIFKKDGWTVTRSRYVQVTVEDPVGKEGMNEEN